MQFDVIIGTRRTSWTMVAMARAQHRSISYSWSKQSVGTTLPVTGHSCPLVRRWQGAG